MRWQDGRRSTNVEDIRGAGGPRRMGVAGGKLGGGALLLMVVISVLMGKNPLELIGMLGGGDGSSGTQQQQQPRNAPANDEAKEFVSVVLADTEDTWTGLFRAQGQRYEMPKMVLFSDQVESACGLSSSATGPFYCPGDHKVYLDLSFLADLKRLGANGDFAVAYVIGHEIGHHVQNLLGTERQLRSLQRNASETEANTLSVRMELQADCYAGVWAHHAQKQRNILEQGDVEEAMNAAASIGDDRLQKMGGRTVNPDGFTHGTSEQRVRWFRTGFQKGSMDACDTFGRGI